MISIGNQKKNVTAIVAKRYFKTTHIAISTISTNTETKKLFLDCLDINNSQRILNKVSNKYSIDITKPLMPLTSSSGKIIEKTTDNNIIEINKIFSYVEKALENKYINIMDIHSINNADAT